MRLLAIICILLLLPILTGCNVVLSTSNELPEIHAFVQSAETSHIEQMIEGLEKGALDLQANMVIHEINIKEEPAQAIKQINKAVRRSTKAIIITPFEHHELDKQLERAQKKEIPLIYLDAEKAYDFPGTYISSDSEKAAERAGQLLAEAIGEKGEVIMLNISPEDSGAAEMETGFMKALQEFPDIRLVNLYNCNGERENTRKTLEDILDAHPNINGIFTACPDTTAAAAETISRSNMDIQIVGFNHTEETLQLVSQGRISSLVSIKSFDMGYEAVRTAVSLAAGQVPMEIIDIGYDVFSQDDLYSSGNSKSPSS